ncbi:hypothetical protein [Rubrivivax gelatinosus]|uniref:PEP-CTERM sorting domain-containing protein n=1 Tax=Rubrivivax gelatinosus (strain NBRC 100245 / IL144) TaxID=983917 RepID=I0HTT4_RUBGI|nr:hypothetical protein [Rubrivivax gelatinosus]BAL96421.1 hypothetical protein RGE_30820 [Rubrivivax gelatinosus IL144]
MPHTFSFRLACLVAAAAIVPTAVNAETAVVWSSSNPALVTNAFAISQVVDGVEVTARGYVAEYDDTDPSKSTIIGPFSTSFADNHQIFGPRTASAGDNDSYGLGLFVAPTPGVAPTGVDYGGSTYIAGFDSGLCCSEAYLGDNPDVPGPPRHQKTDFTLISFSQPVDVARFNTATANAWWAAGWTAAPDLSGGLLAALSNASVVQGKGTQTDPFTHELAGFDAVSWLAIGYAPRVPGYEALGPYSPGDFFLYSVTMSPVPEAASAILETIGLAFVAAAVRRRSLPTGGRRALVVLR